MAREQRRIADQAEANLLERGGGSGRPCTRVDSILEAETLAAGAYGEAGMPVAGEGAPLVAEFSVTEFAAALGMSTDAGKRYVGHALELRYRLPRVWKRVRPGTCGRGWRVGSPRRPSSCPRTRRRLWTGRWRRPRTGSDRSSWTGWWTGDRPVHARRSRGAVASNARMAGTSPSSPGRCTPTTAPSRSTGSSTSPTPSSWRPRSRRSPPSSRTSARPSPSTSAARWRSVSWLAASSRSTWRPPTSVKPVETQHRHRKIVLYVHLSQDALTARVEHGNQLITPGQLRDWCGDAARWS